MKRVWWKLALISSAPWVVVPVMLTGLGAWFISATASLQGTAEARIDALARITGMFVGIALAWNFIKAYKHRD